MTVHWVGYRQEIHLYNLICTLKCKCDRLTEREGDRGRGRYLCSHQVICKSDPNPCLHASYLSLYRVGSTTDPDETVAEGQKTRAHLH